MQFRGPHGEPRHTRGVIGALALPEPGDTSVLPHERTAAKAKSDRLALLRATRANVDPIWGLSLAAGPHRAARARHGARHLRRCRRRRPRARRDRRSRAHRRRSERAIGANPVVLADGHHRFETACAYRDELRAAGEAVGGADAIMMLVVELVDDELDIEPIHRLLDLPDDVDLVGRLDDAFDVVECGANSPEAVEALLARMADEHGHRDRRRDRPLPRGRRSPTFGPRALADEHPAVAATDAAVVEALVDAARPGGHVALLARRPGASPPRSTRARRAPRSCAARCRSRRPAPRRPTARACRRRPRSSHPSPCRGWSSESSDRPVTCSG